MPIPDPRGSARTADWALKSCTLRSISERGDLAKYNSRFVPCQAAAPRLYKGAAPVPIYRLLQNAAFEPERIELMAAAFEDVCRDLRLAPEDALRDAVARAVIKCAQRGVGDLSALRKCAHDAI